MSGLKGNLIVGQSGGPTAVINCSLAGVVKAGLESSKIETVYGMVNGIEGLLKEYIVDLGEELSGGKDINLLKQTPASFLRSCRFKLPKVEGNDALYKKIFNVLEKHNIKYFLYNGGNDSMDTVMKISEYAKKVSYEIKVIGVPKTVDNDLAATDHTPGFASAAKYIATTIKEISRDTDVYDKSTVTVVEIMGRNAGWLTAASALARGKNCFSPDLIYLPEITFSIDKFFYDLERLLLYKKNIIVAVSEGIKTENGKYLFEFISPHIEKDAFGHIAMGGTSAVLKSIIEDRLKGKVERLRSIELTLMQRCAAHLTSKTDVEETFLVGQEAVKAALAGETGKMMVYRRISANPYKIKIESADITKIANVEKTVPRNWINEAGNDVTQEAIDYMKPLILGEPDLVFEDGIPVSLRLDTSKFS
jgi:6-phosphofructokinase 1